MLCVLLIVIPLILPGFALAGKDLQENQQTVCNDTDVKKAGDNFFTCFDIKVHNILDHQNAECNRPFTETLTSYLETANNTCYKDPGMDRRATWFQMLLMFSLRNDSFKAFVNSGGVEWVQAIKQQVAKCASVVGIKNPGDKYTRLWKKSKLIPDIMPCTETIQLKTCVLKAMRAEGLSRTVNATSQINLYPLLYNVLYVSSLFDYMLELCHTHVQKWNIAEVTTTTKQKPEVLGSIADGIVKDAHTTHVLLAIVLTLALSGIIYVVYRECRAKPKSWNNINGNFEMGPPRRQQSLVNNEICEDGSLPASNK